MLLHFSPQERHIFLFVCLFLVFQLAMFNRKKKHKDSCEYSTEYTPPDAGNTHLLLQTGQNKFYDFICKLSAVLQMILVPSDFFFLSPSPL